MDLPEPTYGKLDKPNTQSHTGSVRTYIRKASQNTHTKPHMDLAEPTYGKLSQTYKATHGPSEPTYGKLLTNRTYQATQKPAEPTYGKLNKTNI
jgi:hypothetical protein